MEKLNINVMVFKYANAVKAFATINETNFWSGGKYIYIPALTGVGIARYKLGDFYDSNEGEKIAVKKAKRNLYKQIIKEVKEQIEIATKSIIGMTKFVAELSDKNRYLTRDIKEIAGVNEQKDTKIPF